MSDDPCTDFDEPGLQAGQRPIGYLLGQISGFQKDTEIVSQRMELQPNFVLRQALAGKACPIDRLLAFLDVLLCRATLIVEADSRQRRPRVLRQACV
jgi:hypothetical protein